jgi:hypothetical protein
MDAMPQRVVSLLAASAIVASCGIGAPGTCSPAEGGRAGATAQLRYAAAGEGFLAFTFGFRARSTGFDVPAYRIAQRGPGAFEVELRGVFTRNPDGSPSYEPRPMTASGMSDVRLEPGDDGLLRWSLRTNAARCPVSLERTYVGGTTFPRAQVFVTFGTSGMTIEPPCAVPGEGVSVSGVGFAPGSTVLVDVDGGRVHESKADAAGIVHSVFLVPAVASGPRRVSLRDTSGRSAAISFEALSPDRYTQVRPHACPVE